jgi:APA family basic amino acid/polyamine antiporter
MGRNGDLPEWLAAVHPRFHVPHHAEVAVAVAVCVLVLTVDLRGAIGFSAFGVLLYYFVANLAALSQDDEHRRYPRALQVTGAAGCVVLGLAVPVEALLTGLLVLAAGVLYRIVRR